MGIIVHNIKMLTEVRGIISQIPDSVYVEPMEILSESTIGQHFRHILEFYICLKDGMERGEVSYDDRKRDVRIEQNREYTIQLIEELCTFFKTVNKDKMIKLKANYSENPENELIIMTSLFRELAYALDHTVHHLAIVKIALKENNISMNENLGVAPSTIRYRNNKQLCVQ